MVTTYMAQLRAFSTPAFDGTRLTSVNMSAAWKDKLEEQGNVTLEDLQQQMREWGAQLKQDYENTYPDDAEHVKHLTVRILPKGREAILEIGGYAPALETVRDGEQESVVAGWLKQWQERPGIKEATEASKQRFPDTLNVVQVDMESRTRDALIGRYSTLIVGVLSLGAGLAINATARVERRRQEKIQEKNSNGEEKGGIFRWLKTAGSMCFIAASSILTVGGVLRARQRSLPEMFRDVDQAIVDDALTEESVAQAIAAKDTMLGKVSRMMQKWLWTIVPALNLTGNALIGAGASTTQQGAEQPAQDGETAQAAPKQWNKILETAGTGLGVGGNLFIAAPLQKWMKKFGLEDNPLLNRIVKIQMPVGAGTDQFGTALLASAPLGKIFSKRTGDKDTDPGIMDYAQVLMLPISFLCGIFTGYSPHNKEYDAKSIGAEAARYLHSQQTGSTQTADEGEKDNNIIRLSAVKGLIRKVVAQPEVLNPKMESDIILETLRSVQAMNPDTALDEAATEWMMSAEANQAAVAQAA